MDGLWNLVAASCALLATVVAVTLLRPASPNPQPRRTLQRITYDEAALPRDAAWAPDGQWVVYANDRAGNADLWKQRLGDPDPVRLTTSEANESQPQWSPDGQSIVFRSERDGGGLYVIPANGGVERMVSTFGYEPLWSPDGTLILFKRSAVLPDLPTIYVVGLDGKPPRPVRPDVLGQFRSLHAAWHPDGRRISIWGTIGKEEKRFLTVPLEAGSATTPELSPAVQRDLAGVSAGRFVWAPSRRYIYFEGRAGDTQNVWRITVDPLTEKWIDGPERLTTGAGRRDERGYFAGRHETGLHGDVEQNEAVGLPIRPGQRAHHRPAVSHYRGQHGRSGLRRARRRLEGRLSHRPGGPQRVVGTIDCRRAGAAAAVEHGLAIRETAVVSGRREARVLALCDAGHHPRGSRAQYGWQRRARIDEARPCRDARVRLVERRPGDPRRLSIQSVRAILDVPRSALERERGRRSDCPGHRVGSQAQSLQPAVLARISAGSRFSRTICRTPRRRRSTSYRRAVAPGGRSPTARGSTTSRGGDPTDGSCTSCRIARASRTSGDDDSMTRLARRLVSHSVSRRSDPRSSC